MHLNLQTDVFEFECSHLGDFRSVEAVVFEVA